MSRLDRNHLLLSGGLFENFVVIELVKYLLARGHQVPLYYFRDNLGNEIDLIWERARKVIGIEIKAGQTINSDWFKGQEYLKKIMGNDVSALALVYGGKESQKRAGVDIFSYREVARLHHEFSNITV